MSISDIEKAFDRNIFLTEMIKEPKKLQVFYHFKFFL